MQSSCGLPILNPAPKRYWLLRGWWEIRTDTGQLLERLPSFFALRLALFHLNICQPYVLVRRGPVHNLWAERARVGFFLSADGRHYMRWLRRTQHKGAN
jgi:hypothetical protein